MHRDATPDVERVIAGENGVLSTLRASSVVIDMSSISPVATRRLADAVRARGSEMLDAPVSGLPFRIPLINFDPGNVTWFTGGSFGPEGGVTASVVLLIGCVVLARFARKDDTA